MASRSAPWSLPWLQLRLPTRRLPFPRTYGAFQLPTMRNYASAQTVPVHAGQRRKKGQRAPGDPRIAEMRKVLNRSQPKRPLPPLRMARNRHLRHWTIHRAWLLHRRKEQERRHRELMRQWQSMHAACEELRLTSGPDTREEGYLYRVAMEKKGVYGLNGVPIEYARPQTETPAKVAWNHEWKR